MLGRAARACRQQPELPRRPVCSPAAINVARSFHILRPSACTPRTSFVCNSWRLPQVGLGPRKGPSVTTRAADTIRQSSSSQVSASNGSPSAGTTSGMGASSSPSVSKAVAPAAIDKRVDDPQKIIRTLLAYVWPNAAPHLRFRVVAAGVCLALAKASTIAVPFTFKYIADALTVDHALDTATAVTTLGVGLPLSALLTYGVARTAASGFAELRNTIFSSVSQRAIRLVSVDVFKHLLDLPLQYHLKRASGSVLRVVERGARSINFVLTSLVFNAVPTVLEMGVVSAIFAVQCGWEYSVITIATMAAYVAFTVNITTWRTGIRKSMIKIENEASSMAMDSLLNYETIKYYNGEKFTSGQYDKKLQSLDSMSIKTQSSLSLLNFGQNAIFSVGLTACMMLAARDVLAGHMTVGDLILVNGLLFQLSIPLNFVGMVYREVRQGLIDMGEMFKLLETVPEIADARDATELIIPPYASSSTHVPTAAYKLQPAIEFKDVHFAYTPDRPILRGLNLSVPIGKTVGVVGPSGCGKSTLVRLIFRFYEIDNPPPQGVYVYGQDVRQVTMQSLRRAIGVVPQDTVLFNDTIKANIAYGLAGSIKRDAAPDIDVTQSEIEAAARRAHLHDSIIHFPLQYDTQVGERGLKLSGGEKQRVSLARVMLKDAPILLCDEATSALDTRTEANVMDSLHAAANNRTTLLIAHRLSTVRGADIIFVLDKGVVVESGRHEELIGEEGGLYARMWRQQLQQEHHNTHPKAPTTVIDINVSPKPPL